jgi:hypothetical protein
MKRRYRSLRKSFKMHIGPGLVILWDGHRFPPKGQPACEDEKIIKAIEGRDAFGHMFWRETDPDEIIINPAKVPQDCEAEHLEKAAKRLVELGYNPNPGFLLNQEEEEQEEPPQLPSKTSVSSMKKDELVAVIERFGWGEEIDPSQKVNDLKKAIREKVEESS